MEVGINNYSKDILHLMESNMDIQFVLEEYGLATYVINYIGKVDAGMYQMLRDAAAENEAGNVSIANKFRKIANIFLNSNLMSAQEAAYYVLSLRLSKSSRRTVYINTTPITDRVRMLKSDNLLHCMAADSTDVFMETVYDKYSKRPEIMEDVCLADFVSRYTRRSVVNEEDTDEEQEHAVSYNERQRASVIRFRRYKLLQDPHNYYREQILLFLPWMNEELEVENNNCEQVFIQKRHLIFANRDKYYVFSDESLEGALLKVNNDNEEKDKEAIQDMLVEELSQPWRVDLIQQGGVKEQKKPAYTVSCPPRISDQSLKDKMCQLNKQQIEFVMHILHCFKTNRLPLRLFLSGAAGVGKSLVISCLYQLITKYFDDQPGDEKSSLVVLLCAPSGKAAFAIGGVTLHTAFSW